VEPQRVSSDEILRQARMMRKKVEGYLSAEEIQDAIDQGRP
jgi:antitoxin FitA